LGLNDAKKWNYKIELTEFFKPDLLLPRPYIMMLVPLDLNPPKRKRTHKRKKTHTGEETDGETHV